jgi:ferredoxin-thioredoxin reductase catalytic subunit
MVAGLSKEAKRKYIGLSSCPCHTSGATNQKAVSICAFVFKTNTLTKMIIKRKYFFKKKLV